MIARSSRNPRDVSGTRPWRLSRPFIAALIGSLVSFCAARWYVGTEHTIYYWDFIGWWERSAILNVILSQQPAMAPRAIHESICTSDYNLLAALPVAGWLALGDQSRMWFVLGLVAIYGTLSAACFTLLCSRSPAALVTHPAPGQGELPGTGRSVEPWSLSLIAPMLWVTWSLPFAIAMRGFVDAGGCAFACLVWWLYLGGRRDDRPMLRAVLIGLLLGFLFLFRRYWAFWIAAFIAIAICDAAVTAWRTRARGQAGWYRPLVPPVLAGVVALAFVAIVAFPLLARVIWTPYGDIYSAYNRGFGLSAFRQAGQGVWEIIRENGLYPTLLGIAALAGLCLRADTRRVGILVGGQSLLTLILFRRVQSPGLQHHLLWCLGLSVASGLWITSVARGMTAARRRALVAVLAAAGMLQMAAAFVPGAGPLRFLLAGNVEQLPMVRDDLAEMERLINAVDAEVQAARVNRIYCLASSPVLNFTTLLGYGPSLRKPFVSVTRVGHTADVDKRDGFPRDLLQSDLVIVTDPPQTHLAPADQQVVVVPAKQLLERRGLGGAYEPLPGAFQLADGVKAFLFRRQRPLAADDIRPLCEELQRVYPDRPYIYSPGDVGR